MDPTTEVMSLLAKRRAFRALGEAGAHEIVDGLTEADDRSRRSFSTAATTSSASVTVVRTPRV
jgi:hypothetical protein